MPAALLRSQFDALEPLGCEPPTAISARARCDDFRQSRPSRVDAVSRHSSGWLRRLASARAFARVSVDTASVDCRSRAALSRASGQPMPRARYRPAFRRACAPFWPAACRVRRRCWPVRGRARARLGVGALRSAAVLASSRPTFGATCNHARSCQVADGSSDPGSAEETRSESRSAARRPRHPNEGLPAVSADAIINPPSRLRSVRNCWRLRALSSGSIRSRTVCPEVGRKHGERQRGRGDPGQFPGGQQQAAADLNGRVDLRERLGVARKLLPTGSGSDRRPSTAGAAASAADLGLSSESIPCPMNAVDNRGRAILRISMLGAYPAYRRTNRG